MISLYRNLATFTCSHLMDSSNFPQTPVDAANPSSTPLPLDSSTLPSSTQQQASLQSTATTTDVVIDYDEAEEEIRQFMAELPSGPFNRDQTLSPPPETPSSAPPTVDSATTARQQQEQEVQVQRILSEAQAISTLPGQQPSALSSSPSGHNPLANLSIPRTHPTTERERSQALLSATSHPVPMQVDDEVVEVSYSPLPSNPRPFRPAPPPPPPAPQASQATPELEELSFTRYPRGKTRSSQHRQSTQARDEPPHVTRRGAGDRPTFAPPDSSATSDEPRPRSPLRAPRPSMPFGTFVKDDNPVVATSLDSYLDNPDSLSWKDRASLLPKTDEYPGWDGNPSKLLKYLQTMDVFIRVNQIPERILLAKFRSKLSGEAEQFYSLRVGEPPMPNSWEEWKDAFRERFLGRNWQREMQEKYRAMQYTGEDPNSWLEKFINAIRSVQPNASGDEIQQAVQLRIPQQMAMNLEALRGRQGSVSLTQFMRNFEEMATLQFPHGFRRSNPSRNPTTSDSSSNRPRPSDPRRTVPSSGAARPAQSAPASRPAQASAGGSGPTPRRCYICQSTSHISTSCPQRPAVAALADGEDEQVAEESEEAAPEEAQWESSDEGEVNHDFNIEALSSDSYYWLENSPERLERFGWLDLACRPPTDSLSAPEAVAHPLDYVLALDAPLGFRALDTAVLSIGQGVEAATDELATSGAPVLVSTKQALRLSSSVQTSDAPMRTKAVRAGHAHTTALSLTTRVLINGNPVTIFLDTGAGPSVADARALDQVDVGWRTRLQPMPHKTSFTAFGSKLSPLGVVKTALVFPHPAGNLRLSIEFAVIETDVAPVPFIFGMDWMLAYGVNVMLEHGPYFTIGRAKQRFAIATKTGFALPYVDPDELEACSNRATVAAVTAGRPTTEPTEFEKALALVKVNPELKPKQPEEKYSIPQLECLAVVWALEKLHVFLDGVNFTVWTDAGAMKTLMDMQSPSRHMLRWQLAVQEYRNFMKIRHRAGKANGAADGLSRCPLPNDESNPAADLSTEPELRVQALSFAMLDDSFFDAIRQSYAADKDFSKIHLALRYIPRSIYMLMKSKMPFLSLEPASESFANMLLASQERAASCIADAVAYAQKRWDEKHVEPPFEVGDEVLVSTKHFQFKGERKLIPPYVGPFAVLEKVGPNAIRVALTGEYARKHPVFPVSLCKPYHRTEAERFPGRREPAPPQPDLVDGVPQWVVEKVLDQRAVKPRRGQKDKTRKKEFLVKWEGYPEKYNRWVLEDDLQNAKEALQDYFESRRLSKRKEDVEEEERPKQATFANGEVPLEATPHMYTRSRAQKSP
ncbi:Retrovirus-related Pol polyprotein from transposon 297 [Rhodotorula toruloides]|nr:Retrovirus-related Pol polyprotein from transposon 297 [Rhodotorula toruloides]